MKRVIPIAAVFLILVGVGLQFAPESLLGTPAKLDLAIAVYESENEPVAEASVMAGTTANAMRKAGKWRQFDQNKLPEAMKTALSASVAKTGVPCIVLVRGGKVVTTAKLPATDADLAALIARNGGW